MKFGEILGRIHTALVKYSNDLLGDNEMTFELNIHYAIIVQAIKDLYTGNLRQQKNAVEYFKSRDYEEHCRLVNIDKDLMDYIVANPHKYDAGFYSENEYAEDY